MSIDSTLIINLAIPKKKKKNPKQQQQQLNILRGYLEGLL
jgi:hypothetical protein